MARTVNEIYTALLADKESRSELSSLDSVSSVAIWRVWLYMVASVTAIHEQLWDAAQGVVEATIAGASPNSAEWIRQKVFDFQFSTTNPQTPILNENFNVVYSPIVEDYKIVTRCSVQTAFDRQVNIKVAKGQTPVKLTVGEATALSGYISALLVPGVVYNVISLDSDKVFIDADVYFNSLYASSIQSDVEQSVNDYFATLSDNDFDGALFVAKLQDAIQAVVGVRDVNLKVVKARPDTTAFASATVVYDLANGVNLRFYNPNSGYFGTETTASNTISDTINYIPV